MLVEALQHFVLADLGDLLSFLFRDLEQDLWGKGDLELVQEGSIRPEFTSWLVVIVVIR